MKTPSRATAVTGQAAILWVILAYLLLGVIYSFATPVFEASDEIWHYPVVRELRNSHRLPVQRPGVKTDWEQEGSQPPLYYALAAGITFWVDDSDYEQVMIRNPFVKAGVPGTPDNVNFIAHPPGQGPWQGGTTLAVYLIRWLSLLMGAGTVYFAWRLARTVYPGHERVALLTAAIVAFNPMTLFINASVNNDNLLMLLATITLWLLADELMAMKPGVRWGRTLLLGLLMGMAALTKVSGLMLLPVAALALTLWLLFVRPLPPGPRKSFWSFLLLLWPLLIGFTRLYLDVHWSSDILAGWGLGLLITSLAALLILPSGNDDGTPRSP